MSVHTREYQSDFVRKYVFQGRAEGRIEAQAAAVLADLDARGLAVSDIVRARITATDGADQLAVWLRRAATVDDIERLFD